MHFAGRRGRTSCSLIFLVPQHQVSEKSFCTLKTISHKEPKQKYALPPVLKVTSEYNYPLKGSGLYWIKKEYSTLYCITKEIHYWFPNGQSTTSSAQSQLR